MLKFWKPPQGQKALRHGQEFQEPQQELQEFLRQLQLLQLLQLLKNISFPPYSIFHCIKQSKLLLKKRINY